MSIKIIPNQKVKITKEKDYYVIQSLQDKSTPGFIKLYKINRNIIRLADLELKIH